ncbi:molecular chaperone TorD family protein [Bacillus aquiflavi]|uniref:molecular chaperone TorD family protein n=1 Tax=Bacillus aquiflavi TaxID=2672567 RepID=UPI001CA8A162|nr:molecular chaperone TorD family protein [Bacillus aquiflavi]UAC48775.1 molecular chaperone TorD family protein [Bacillus aquiflavi]
MMGMKEECSGKLALANILSSIWFGDWEHYEEIFKQMPKKVKKQFVFHRYYNREQVKLWYENHFFIPGDYFVPPYFSSYVLNDCKKEKKKENLLCLIGIYEKTGFYFPLEKEYYPDHFGCLTAFLSSVLQEQIKAINLNETVYFKQLRKLEEKMLIEYIIPVLQPLSNYAKGKIRHRFFQEFLTFFNETMRNEWSSAAS